MFNFAIKLNNLNYYVMFSVNFKILKDCSCEEFINSVKTLIRFDINKEFSISVDYFKEFTSVSINVPSLCDYVVCSDFILYSSKFMDEKNIKGFLTECFFKI